jgi:hypothetical protein
VVVGSSIVVPVCVAWCFVFSTSTDVLYGTVCGRSIYVERGRIYYYTLNHVLGLSLSLGEISRTVFYCVMYIHVYIKERERRRRIYLESRASLCGSKSTPHGSDGMAV